jgi:hypothetical protein
MTIELLELDHFLEIFYLCVEGSWGDSKIPQNKIEAEKVVESFVN